VIFFAILFHGVSSVLGATLKNWNSSEIAVENINDKNREILVNNLLSGVIVPFTHSLKHAIFVLLANELPTMDATLHPLCRSALLTVR
jgi:hypothetical protein